MAGLKRLIITCWWLFVDDVRLLIWQMTWWWVWHLHTA